MEYTVVVQDDFILFIEAVNSLIKEGWMPQGGISLGTKNSKNYFAQAMIKK